METPITVKAMTTEPITFKFKAEGQKATIEQWGWPLLRDLYDLTMGVVEELEGKTGEGFHYPRFYAGSVGCESIASPNFQVPCQRFARSEVSQWPTSAQRQYGKLSSFMTRQDAHLKAAGPDGAFRIVPLRPFDEVIGPANYEEIEAEVFRVGGQNRSIELRAEGRVIPQCRWNLDGNPDERTRSLAHHLYERVLVFGKVERAAKDGRIEAITVDDFRFPGAPRPVPQDTLETVRRIRRLWPDELSTAAFMESVRGEQVD